jgi:hypothetical protein
VKTSLLCILLKTKIFIFLNKTAIKYFFEARKEAHFYTNLTQNDLQSNFEQITD